MDVQRRVCVHVDAGREAALFSRRLQHLVQRPHVPGLGRRAQNAVADPGRFLGVEASAGRARAGGDGRVEERPGGYAEVFK